jgi:hypothetical protein
MKFSSVTAAAGNGPADETNAGEGLWTTVMFGQLQSLSSLDPSHWWWPAWARLSRLKTWVMAAIWSRFPWPTV